ncbi:MAG: hypothetical protein PHW46_03935 [Candidatus Omnitrophica bacterium]|nr:hypothetical protein [Candidatus Omnitrophota bacterium]
MAKKQEIYNWITAAGAISFIPIILVSGAIVGYLVGGYLEKKFALPAFVLPLSVGIGTVASMFEVARIINFISKLDNKK